MIMRDMKGRAALTRAENGWYWLFMWLAGVCAIVGAAVIVTGLYGIVSHWGST